MQCANLTGVSADWPITIYFRVSPPHVLPLPLNYAVSLTVPLCVYIQARLNTALAEHEETLAAVRARLAHPPASVLPTGTSHVCYPMRDNCTPACVGAIHERACFEC